MTIQERIDNELIANRFKNGEWKEGNKEELAEDYEFMAPILQNWYIPSHKLAIFKSTKEDKNYLIYLYTEKREYSIIIKPTYIGCQYSNRYYEPLEDWTRGRDLPDGKCTPITMFNIILAILGTELIAYDDGSQVPHWCGSEQSSNSETFEQ